MENVRYNISPCSPQEASLYISKIDEAIYIPRNIVKADERSHYDRYSYVKNDSRVAVVYDTYAHVISITASKLHADELMKLFGIDGSKTVKTSTVPAQGSGSDAAIKNKPAAPTQAFDAAEQSVGKRAKLFVDPATIRRPEPATFTAIATAKGAEISTDEIYPPQRARKRSDRNIEQTPYAAQRPKTTFGDGDNNAERNAPSVGMNISANAARTGVPRRATISFGDEDDYGSKRAAAPRPDRPTGTGIFAEIAAAPVATADRQDEQQAKRKRGRPPKNQQAESRQKGAGNAPQNGNDRNFQNRPTDGAQQQQAAPQQVEQGQGKRRRGRPPKINQNQQGALVTAPGYEAKPVQEPTEHIMQFSRQNMADLFSRLKKSGNMNVVPDTTTEYDVAYMVSDRSGQKVSVAFSEKRVSLRILGIYGELFKTVKAYAEKLKAKNPVVVIAQQRSAPPRVDVSSLSEPMRKLYKRVPTAFAFLSEQSRADFICGMKDFAQSGLSISDYSVLLVPPFRALERFIFDLQRAEGIQVKMIGQAFDKDDRGNYILKRGYQQRIGSVIYAEVMVALYTEYFMQRNFFAHSDNTDGNATRSLPDRASASRIFEHLLDVVDYNARKLKEIGFSIEPKI